MMQFVLASGPGGLEQVLAQWGQIAAIILVIQLFVFVLIALALNAGFAFLSAFAREKVELVKKLRPVVDSVNSTTEAAIKGTLPVASANENKIVRTVAEIPAQTMAVEKKIEQGSDRVANAVIEFRARTVMVQGIVKAFFLPGLIPRIQQPSKMAEIKSPGLKMLLEQHSPEVEVESAEGRAAEMGEALAIRPSQIKGTSTEEEEKEVSHPVLQSEVQPISSTQSQPRDVLLEK